MMSGWNMTQFGESDQVQETRAEHILFRPLTTRCSQHYCRRSCHKDTKLALEVARLAAHSGHRDRCKRNTSERSRTRNTRNTPTTTLRHGAHQNLPRDKDFSADSTRLLTWELESEGFDGQRTQHRVVVPHRPLQLTTQLDVEHH